MTMNRRSLFLGVLAVLLLPSFVSAEQGIGIVTAIQGQASVSRASLPQPGVLRFKDDVFFRDRIATRERSTVRLLFGGKGTLTIREHSEVTLDESVTPEGAKRSVLSLLSGKIGAAIARALMRPGDAVEVRTPDAVASVRGTALIAEYIPPTTRAAASFPILLASAAPGPLLVQAPGTGGTSNFFVLSGQVTITPQGQPPLTLGPLQAISVTATAGGVQAGAIQNMTPAQAAQAAQGLDAGKSHVGEAEVGKVAQGQAEMAASLANNILQATGGQPAGTGQPVLATTLVGSPTPIGAPPVPPTTSETGENLLPPGALLSLDNVTLEVGGGASLATFDAGTANTVIPLAMSGGGTAYVTAPLLVATGNLFTHVGPIAAFTNSANLVGEFGESAAPLVKITGTTFNNSGSLFALSGESTLETFAPVLAVKDATLKVESSVVSMDTAYAFTSGKILDFVNSKVSVDGPIFSLQNGSGAVLSGGPMISLSGSTLTAQGQLGDSDETGNVVYISGPILDAANSSITLGSYRLPRVDPGSDTTVFDLPPGVPQINLANSTLTSADTGSFLDFGSGYVPSYNGLLLTATDSTISLAGALTQLWSEDDVTSTGADPLIQLTRSKLSLGSNLLRMEVGSLSLAGPFLSATDSALSVSGSLIVVDNAVLNASLPIINLINSTLNTSSPVDSNGAMWVNGSGSVLNVGPVFQLNNSILNVQNGALLTVTGGSYMKVTGDLATLTNGSKITVLNGPLIAADGSGTKLEITGNLLNFLSSGNQVLISNSLGRTGLSYDSVPYVTSGGGTVMLPGATPIINNPGGNTMDFLGSSTKSAIKATNGATICVKTGCSP